MSNADVDTATATKAELIDTSYTVYYADEKTPPVTFSAQLPKEPGLDQLKSILNEWFPNLSFEHVYGNVGHGPKHVKDMFVDEHGLMKDLPINKHCAFKPEFYPGELVGTVVVFHRKVWF